MAPEIDLKKEIKDTKIEPQDSLIKLDKDEIKTLNDAVKDVDKTSVDVVDAKFKDKLDLNTLMDLNNAIKEEYNKSYTSTNDKKELYNLYKNFKKYGEKKGIKVNINESDLKFEDEKFEKFLTITTSFNPYEQMDYLDASTGAIKDKGIQARNYLLKMLQPYNIKDEKNQNIPTENIQMKDIYKLPAEVKANLAFDMAILKVLQSRQDFDANNQLKQLAWGKSLDELDRNQLDAIRNNFLSEARYYQKEIYTKLFKQGENIPVLRKQNPIGSGDGSSTNGYGNSDNFGRIFFDYDRVANIQKVRNEKGVVISERTVYKYNTNERFVLWPENDKKMDINLKCGGINKDGGNISIKIGDYVLNGSSDKLKDGEKRTPSFDVNWNDLPNLAGSGITVDGNSIHIDSEKIPGGKRPIIQINTSSNGDDTTGKYDEVVWDIAHTGIMAKKLPETGAVMGNIAKFKEGFQPGSHELTDKTIETIKSFKDAVEDNYLRNTTEGYKVPITISTGVDASGFKSDEDIQKTISETQTLIGKLYQKIGSKEYVDNLKNQLFKEAEEKFPGKDRNSEGQKHLAINRALSMVSELANDFGFVKLRKVAELNVGEIYNNKREASMKIGN